MISLLSEIEFIKTGILPALIQDYLLSKGSVSSLHKYPFEFSAFEKVMADKSDKSKEAVDRKLLLKVLKEQYSSIPAFDTVTKNIESLISEKTFTIVAAHQPCLFLGPLYNIYKISCTIHIANRLKQTFPDYHFVPVFWMGSEDHDTEELNHAFIKGEKIEWKEAGSGAIGRLKTESLEAVVQELKGLSASPEIISILQEGLTNYRSFGRFTQYFVHEIFREQGLVVIDQDDAQLKSRFREVIKEEVLNSTAFKVLKPNIDFLEREYKAQAKPREINFFYLGENYRERIVYNPANKRFEVNKHPSVSFSADEMIAEIEQHPERFSPNVIYRPLYQEMILPNLAFVGGAAELSYWLELKPLFDFFRVNYPMQVMRNSVALLPASVLKKMEKLNLKAEDFFGDVEQLINRYVQRNRSEDSGFAEEKKRLEELYQSVLSKAETADASLKNNAAAEKQKALAALDHLESKMLKAEKRKQETAVNQIRSIHAVLFPGNTLQERVENFIPYYDKDFIGSLVKLLDPFSKLFKIMAV